MANNRRRSAHVIPAGTPNTDTPAPVAPPVALTQAQTDRALLDRIVARYGADNGYGPSTGNVHWSLPKSARPAGSRGPIIVSINTPGGAVNVPATIMTVVGMAMNVADFACVDSASGQSKVWTSATVAKRVKAAGYELTKRSKIWLPNVAAKNGTRSMEATVTALDALL